MDSMTRQLHGPALARNPDAQPPRADDSWLHSLPLVRRVSSRSYPEELLDQGPHDHDELRETFRDMRRVNSLLGGAQLTIRGIQRLTGHLNPGGSLSILDIGTGHADIPRAVMNWSGKHHVSCQAIGLDLDHATLLSGTQVSENHQISFVQGDGLALPFADDSVDIAMSSMTLHHFTDDDAITSLREMARVSRLGIVVNDLTRALHGYVVAWLLARAFTRNRLTRHDAHRSIQRSRTTSELEELAREAGLHRPVFDSKLGYRVAMTAGVRPW